MHLTPREIDKLLLHGAGFLAQKRLARGLRLNYPEATSLIASQLLELIRDGHSVAELMDLGRRLLGRAEVMDGVAELISEVQVEGTFGDGTKLVTVHHPIVAEHGDLALALQGSFLPVPERSLFAEPFERLHIGEVLTADGDLVLNEDRPSETSQSPTSATGRSRSAATTTFLKSIALCSSIAKRPTACGSTFPREPPSVSSLDRKRPSPWWRSPAPASHMVETRSRMAR